jgi:hypothetical protein
MDIKNLVIGGLVGLVVLLAGLAVIKQSAPTQDKQPPLGALSSPDIASPYLSFGGVRQWAGSMEMRSGTSTVCSIQSPAATTTLVSATARFDTTPGYTTIWMLGHATTAYSTTTALVASKTLASGARGDMVATTTALTDTRIPPSTFVNLALSTSTVGSTFAPVGECKAVFREI